MRISEVTRRDIVDYLLMRDYPYYGRFELTEFLGRTWDISSMPSTDPRFQNASGDIWQHMINNSDWDDEYLLWRYLELNRCDDEIFLRFLETCLHPVVVNEEGVVTESAAFFNEKLKPDGYQLQISKSISGRPIYTAVDLGTKGGVTVVIGQNFWIGFLAYLQILTEKNYFCQSFPGECSDGCPVGRDDRQIQLALQQELGQIRWPFKADSVPETETILRIIEFFFRYVAKPTESWYHQYCGSYHPKEFDVGKGRYEYTIEVNKMFAGFKHQFKLQRGKVLRSGSVVLDTAIISGDFSTKDEHLNELIQRAVDNFFDSSGTRKYDALRSLVDAFERIKTLEGTDKKKSVDLVLSKISSVEDIREHFDIHLRKMTEIANNFTIRHHEHGKTELKDPELVEYLFYSYFNLIRFMLVKYENKPKRKRLGKGLEV